jgi:hypothetical protein
MKKRITKIVLATIIAGSLLNVIIGYSTFIKKGFTGENLVKAALTFLVTFCVFLYLSAQAKSNNRDLYFDNHPGRNN